MDISRLALRLFGDYYRKSRPGLSFLANDLMKARIYVPLEKWLSMATLYSLVLSFVVVTLGMIVAAFLFHYVVIWDIFFRPTITEHDLLKLMVDLGAILSVILVCFSFVSFLFVSYPWVRAWERKRKIDSHLPYAIGWMSSMASIGVIPYMIFKKLSEAEEFFGEVSEEAKLVVRDVELLGLDFISALRNLAATTPSTHMRTFIQGAITNALSGGEMGTYFISKARENMEENRKRFSDFITALGMISEVYITGLVAGPLFVIVMFAAIMMLRGASPMILVAIIYGFIPLGSVLFLLLTDALTPEGIK
jgi:flagellar protein FlaJ